MRAVRITAVMKEELGAKLQPATSSRACFVTMMLGQVMICLINVLQVAPFELLAGLPELDASLAVAASHL